MNMNSSQASMDASAQWGKAKRATWDVVADGVTRDLGIWEHYLEITIGAAAAATLSLPDVAEAAGHMYTIRELDAGNDISVLAVGVPSVIIYGNTPETAVTFGTTFPDLTAADDILVFWSDGFNWHIMIDVTT